MYKTLLIVDDVNLSIENENISTISFDDYVTHYPKKNEPKVRIINFCDSATYLSKGYYCSLLAEARKHKVLPSVSTINDLRELTAAGDSKVTHIKIPTEVTRGLDADKLILFYVFFGYVENPDYKKLGKLIFDAYMAPILKVTLTHGKLGLTLTVSGISFAALAEPEKKVCLEKLDYFTQRVWTHSATQKRLRWDMAILVNPNEKQPPSNKSAISLFIKAAAQIGIHAECITAGDLHLMSQYDAIFIRETTAIDHYTYSIARKAAQDGIIVIDDSTSILRCCNKVYLHDAFSYNHIPSIKTLFVYDTNDATIKNIESQFNYPLVLKMPEGTFSKGVYKITDRAHLLETLTHFLKETALLLVQEFLYTRFDWRIGVLNGRAIYACKYYMVPDHWQIYNHKNKKVLSGGFETLPTFEVPKPVLDAAIKACSVVGKGLYGVDIKQKGKQVYVVEVNDNPNIDHGVEDHYLGNELYMLVMSEFLARLEKRGR